MAETKEEKRKKIIEELKSKREKLVSLSTDWNEIENPPIEPSKEDRDAALIRINELLGIIKSEINLHWGPDINPDEEVHLMIQDKRINPWRKQVEDIEGDVGGLEGF